MEQKGDRPAYRKGKTIPSSPTTHGLIEEPSPPRMDDRRRLGVTSMENTFETLLPWPGTEKALKAVKKILEGPAFMAMIYGGTGNGKTRFLEGAVLELDRRGIPCRVMQFSEILSQLRMAIDDPDKSYDGLLRQYQLAERLVIDDIGSSGSLNDFGKKILEAIVVIRYGRELFTLMASNVDPKELPERVVSRLEDRYTSFLVYNQGEDYRPQKVTK